MGDDSDVDAIGSLLADECARTILTETVEEALSAEELSDRCGVSPPTIYRRLEALEAHDLISKRTQPDADGHHYNVYTATLDRIEVDLTEDGLHLRLTRRDRMADRFTQFIGDMR
ncbi:winged helix-turn-helix domain-containing protein [Halococcus sp. IIIV-5B]|uniref:ArsR/SmtB family transcription factor n=1 Tax=Halococcus sp. IIIV-5B TaxID=2321230 RepID=UPI001F327313|nr:winged helix-turn-helix domain-containing protein [Halococcus sp. IIIV-5B]